MIESLDTKASEDGLNSRPPRSRGWPAAITGSWQFGLSAVWVLILWPFSSYDSLFWRSSLHQYRVVWVRAYCRLHLGCLNHALTRLDLLMSGFRLPCCDMYTAR
jgi:hypothetical protein